MTSKSTYLGKEVKHLLALSEKFAMVYNEMIGGFVTMDLMEHFLLGSSESLGYSTRDYELALQVLNHVDTDGVLEGTYQMLLMTFCQFLYNVGFVIDCTIYTNEVNVLTYNKKKTGLKLAHAVHNAYKDTLNNAMSIGVDMLVIEEFKKQFGNCEAQVIQI